MAIKKASMCARVTSTYMEFTFTFGPKPEFKFSFNLELSINDQKNHVNKEKKHLFWWQVCIIME